MLYAFLDCLLYIGAKWRLTQLTIIVKAQRKEWIEKGYEDPKVNVLNADRWKYFSFTLEEHAAEEKVVSAAEDSDDKSLFEVALLTDNITPRLFKDGQ